MKKVTIISTIVLFITIFASCKNRPQNIENYFEYSEENNVQTLQKKQNANNQIKKNNRRVTTSSAKIQIPQNFRDQNIMGRGKVSSQSMANFFRKTNKNISANTIKKFAEIYISEANIEEVNYEVAWVQMCLETNYLRFGGQVDKKQNNFCGLGALDGGAKGESFTTPRLGVRAQIQHLKAYASTKPLILKCIDPRFSLVKPRGCATKISHLTKRWASDKDYHLKLSKFLQEMRAM